MGRRWHGRPAGVGACPGWRARARCVSTTGTSPGRWCATAACGVGGAFAAYRYREELFPTLLFRRAYDILQERCPTRADREYVRVLHLAASTTEADVETALGLLLDAGTVPTFDAVRELVRQPAPGAVPALTMPAVTYGVYDQLLLGRCAHGE
ncbi:MAG TPA: hypothetical protein VIU62_23890 [Chloroflexota bacterium]